MVRPSHVVVVHPATGEIKGLPKRTFSGLGIKERQQIENWVLANPEVLGEKLLILSSEFDRFDKSDKRLDILALDSSGKLVIVELKREVSDSLAELQGIRYAAFCSNMRFEQVVALRAEYSKSDEPTAESEIRDFVCDPNFSRIDNKPRIILAAGAFDDPHLTSSVLWLRTFQVDIQCVELAPYELPDKRLVLVPRILIPLPEAAEYIVGVEEKVASEQTAGATRRFHQDRNKQILGYFRQLFPERSPTEAPVRNYMQIPSGYGGIHFEWWYRSKGSDRLLDIAIHFETPSKEKNRSLCESMKTHRPKIENAVGEPVVFDPDWGQKWAAVYIERLAEPWSDAMAKWAAEKMVALIKVVQPLLNDALAGSKFSS